MSALTAGHQGARAPSSDWSDLLIYSSGGFVLGVTTTIIAIAIDLTVFVSAQWSTGTGDGPSWSMTGVVAFGLFSVAVAVVMGRWLWRLRRWMGESGDHADSELVARKRRHFAAGAMLCYVPLAPIVCLLMLAFANST